MISSVVGETEGAVVVTVGLVGAAVVGSTVIETGMDMDKDMDKASPIKKLSNKALRESNAEEFK